MKVITGTVRSSFLNVFEPRLNELNGNSEYSMMILIDKGDQDTVGRIKKAVKLLVENKWQTKPPANLRYPLRDGDVEKPNDSTYTGKYFMNLKSKTRPGVVDKQLQAIINPNEFVSGDYCRVSMSGFAYDKTGNRGVSFSLNNIQVLDKGEPLSGKTRPENDFEAIEDIF